MSAFLGPIHVKMYDRILYQDTMSQALLDLSANNQWNTELSDEVNAKAPTARRESLETIIDEGNIHGWLSMAVERCEQRFALTVCGILENHPERMDEMKNVMKSLGEVNGFPTATDAEEAFQALHDILLDGMPCDFPFNMAETSAESVSWQVASCPHTSYWSGSVCGVEAYYQLRDAWMDGALEGSGFNHMRPELYSHMLRKGK